ncbi:MAG: sulfatase-like hydrolase/transferase [Paracoccaceae bacterium]|nr:MAG: sulfatase-like hydrolase/transferase [Paracoccaceae bacterium]
MPRLAAAAVFLHLVLILPNHPGALTLRALLLFPLELPVILLLLLALPPGRPARIACIVLTAVLVVLTLLKAADIATHLAYDRRSNPMADWPLVGAGWNLARGMLGGGPAALLLAGVAAGLAALVALLWASLRLWSRVSLPGAAARAAGIGAALAGVVALAEAGQAMRLWTLPQRPPGAAFTLRSGVEHALYARRAAADLRAFRQAALSDPWAARTGVLDRLGGRELRIVFVESYARSSFDNPLYAPTHTATLRRAGSALSAAGLAAGTLWLQSPIEGGQSWLAHATLASGLTVNDLSRHAALVASPRRTLWQFAQDAGYHTVAVAPAITRAWPEGVRLGFDTLLDRDAMGYRGLPFNWVTMPDQFTLARWPDRLPPDPRPVFAQVALISSHAPWVPVPRLIPWDAVGDGTEFDAMAAGDPPEVVWRDPDRIRDQYRQSLDYALSAALADAARQGGADAPLILILGDHPPAAFVSQTGSPDVPLHVIGPPEALAPLAGWGLTPGLIPGPDTPRWPMADFRDRFLAAFTTP